MRIAIEIPYYSPGARGPSVYGENLVRALGPVSPQDDFLVFGYFFRDHARHLARISKLFSPNVALAICRWPQRLVRLAEERLGYPVVDRQFLKPRGIDVFHDSGWHPVDERRTARVCTLHGTGMSLVGRHQAFDQILLPHLLRSQRIIALSGTVRDFVIKYYPVDKKKMTVVPYGVDHETFRVIQDRKALEEARRRYALPERFLLCVGPFQFRDNIEHLLCLLRECREASWLRGLHLVLAGGLEEHGPDLVSWVRRNRMESLVHFSGHVPHKDLAAFYNLAEVLVHSSYYEEGGAQPVEASACGVPVLASNATGWVQEIEGAGAIVFNPHLLDDLAAKLRRVLENPGLRAELRGRGLEWSRRFSWEATARATAEIYHAAAAET